MNAASQGINIVKTGEKTKFISLSHKKNVMSVFYSLTSRWLTMSSLFWKDDTDTKSSVYFTCFLAYYNFRSIQVSGKLPTYPSPKPTLSLSSHLEQNVGLGEG